MTDKLAKLKELRAKAYASYAAHEHDMEHDPVYREAAEKDEARRLRARKRLDKKAS